MVLEPQQEHLEGDSPNTQLHHDVEEARTSPLSLLAVAADEQSGPPPPPPSGAGTTSSSSASDAPTTDTNPRTIPTNTHAQHHLKASAVDKNNTRTTSSTAHAQRPPLPVPQSISHSQLLPPSETENKNKNNNTLVAAFLQAQLVHLTQGQQHQRQQQQQTHQQQQAPHHQHNMQQQQQQRLSQPGALSPDVAMALQSALAQSHQGRVQHAPWNAAQLLLGPLGASLGGTALLRQLGIPQTQLLSSLGSAALGAPATASIGTAPTSKTSHINSSSTPQIFDKPATGEAIKSPTSNASGESSPPSIPVHGETDSDPAKVGESSFAPKDNSVVIPCRARGLPPDHTFKTAYFVIHGQIKHGDDLICSHRACKNGGIKFRYCSFCGVPVAKRNFRQRHNHGEKTPTKEDQNEKSSEKAVSQPADPQVSALSLSARGSRVSSAVGPQAPLVASLPARSVPTPFPPAAVPLVKSKTPKQSKVPKVPSEIPMKMDSEKAAKRKRKRIHQSDDSNEQNQEPLASKSFLPKSLVKSSAKSAKKEKHSKSKEKSKILSERSGRRKGSREKPKEPSKDPGTGSRDAILKSREWHWAELLCERPAANDDAAISSWLDRVLVISDLKKPLDDYEVSLKTSKQGLPTSLDDDSYFSASGKGGLSGMFSSQMAYSSTGETSEDMPEGQGQAFASSIDMSSWYQGSTESSRRGSSSRHGRKSDKKGVASSKSKTSLSAKGSSSRKRLWHAYLEDRRSTSTMEDEYDSGLERETERSDRKRRRKERGAPKVVS